MAELQWRRIHLPDTTLEVAVRGAGDPVVVVQTAATADEFVPFATRPELDDHRLVLYHRRGYAGSDPVRGPGSIARDARDCRHLMAALGIERAHLVGGSYSAAVALQLAVDTPDRVHTLTLIEPPPVFTSAADDFLAATDRILEDYRLHGAAPTLDSFLSRVVSPDWRVELDRHLPGSAARAERDADTFFGTDLPALRDWSFAAEDARRITAPVLYVGGSESGPWFAEVHREVLRRFPQAQDVTVAGAGHSLPVTHPAEVAAAVGAFLRVHPLGLP
ncbi:alpha/beta fold hydrolase [Kocuria sp. M1R5S2]|uniref:alpha/beta fold hydrolase n=1 Tax=Kocuria rhizosphaerae TaxID=3376285 RepID=UPI0037BD2EE2